MKRRHLLFLYPPQWRGRYQREFEALLDVAEMKWPDYLDVAKGALVMWMETFVRKPAWQAIAMFTLIGLAIGAVASQTMTTVYISTATLQGSGGSALTEPSLKKTLSRGRLTTVINELDLYGEDRKRKPLEDVVEQMRHDTRISHATGREGSGAIAVAFAYPDPRTAQRVANALAATIIRDNPVSVIDPANLPMSPTSPNVRNVVSMGALCGLIAGALLAALSARVRRLHHHSA